MVVINLGVLDSDIYHLYRDTFAGGKESAFGRVWESVYQENLRLLADKVEKLKEGDSKYPKARYEQIGKELDKSAKDREDSIKAAHDAAVAAQALAQSIINAEVFKLF